MTTDSKNGKFKSTSFRVHVSKAKMFDEICKLHNYDGMTSVSKTDHIGIMIQLYADTLKKKNVKPGDNIAAKILK